MIIPNKEEESIYLRFLADLVLLQYLKVVYYIVENHLTESLFASFNCWSAIVANTMYASVTVMSIRDGPCLTMLMLR